MQDMGEVVERFRFRVVSGTDLYWEDNLDTAPSACQIATIREYNNLHGTTATVERRTYNTDTDTVSDWEAIQTIN